MADKSATPPPPPSTLQKPPGYRNPNNTAAPRPLPPKTLPPAFRHVGKPTAATRYNHHRRRRRPNSKSICCRLCIFLIVVVISILFLLAIAGAISYLYFQPHLPYFRLQSIHTPHFNVTTKSDGSGTFLDADLVVKIFASNQNNGKILVEYSESSGDVYVEDEDGDVEMGRGTMLGFEQEKRNATVIKYEVKAKGVIVDDVVGRRVKGRLMKREMKIGVEIRMKMGLGLGVGAGADSDRWRTGRVPVRVDCSPVSLKEVRAGGVLPKCHIYLFRW